MKQLNRFTFLLTIFVIYFGHLAKGSNEDRFFDVTSLLRHCLLLKGTPKSVLISRDDPSSQKSYERLNNEQNWIRLPYVRPLAYLEVRNGLDVSNSVTCAKGLKIRVVPKSGGHSFAKYSFGDNSTVVVDLQKLTQISVDKIHKTATVGSGVILAHLYWAIWTQGKFVFPGGICLSVGAGLSLGGGLGYLTNRYGLASDNVLEMEMVDANGAIRLVNGRINKDLFWALRGAGGGNFGIVTKIKYRLFPGSDLTFQSITLNYNISEFRDVFKAWDSWNAANKFGTSYSTIETNTTSITLDIVDADLSDGDVVRIISLFPRKTLYKTTVQSLNFIQLIATLPVSGFNLTKPKELAHVNGENRRKYASDLIKSYFVSKTIGNAELEIFESIMERVPPDTRLLIESMGGATNQIKPDATAFVHRNSLYNIQIGVNTQINTVSKWIMEFDEFVLQCLDNGESYQNYIDWQLKDYLVRYYGTNLPRLVDIKKRIDRNNFFYFPQSIPTSL